MDMLIQQSCQTKNPTLGYCYQHLILLCNWRVDMKLASEKTGIQTNIMVLVNANKSMMGGLLIVHLSLLENVVVLVGQNILAMWLYQKIQFGTLHLESMVIYLQCACYKHLCNGFFTD